MYRTVALAVLVAVMSHSVTPMVIDWVTACPDPTSRQTVEQDFNACFTNENITEIVNFNDLASLLSLNDTQADFCADKETYKRIAKCASARVMQCFSSAQRMAMQGYIPSENSTDYLIDDICAANATNLDVNQCVNNTAQDQSKCETDKRADLARRYAGNTASANYVCELQMVEFQCRKTSTRSCGCPTSAFIVNPFIRHLSVPKCKSLQDSTGEVVCDENGNFRDNAAIPKAGTIVILLTFAATIVRLI